ncbi:hypothetical protein BDZ85DRAFT_127292 [Elsinoe ampelina]|uniref:Transcription factor domain-containing protein n=1 Tax=Elsinoe ampelina TaxID=302913 RepID=A0A6A6GAI3_9PEZI|nr:hypothetical protein BDZ85DRAFT_127292 [Elsinoe ampelina]
MTQRRLSPSYSRPRHSPPPVTNFEFLSFGHPEQAKSEDARRKVRSHVTKQQHFREQRSLNMTLASAPQEAVSPQPSVSSKGSPPNMSSYASSAAVSRRTSTSTTGSGRIITRVDSSSEGVSQSDLALLRAAMYESATPAQSPDSSIQAQPLVIPTTTHIDLILWYPPNWQSSVQTLLSHYAMVIAPRQPFFATGHRPSTLHDTWLPFLMSTRTTLNAALLLSATHFANSHGYQVSNIDIESLRCTVLSDVTTSLSSGSDKPSDELIATVILLAQYEAFISNAQTFQLHMSGLRKMVMARGDLKTTGLEGLMRNMLIWLIRESGFAHRPSPSPSTSPG